MHQLYIGIAQPACAGISANRKSILSIAYTVAAMHSIGLARRCSLHGAKPIVLGQYNSPGNKYATGYPGGR